MTTAHTMSSRLVLNMLVKTSAMLDSVTNVRQISAVYPSVTDAPIMLSDKKNEMPTGRDTYVVTVY